MNARLLSAIVFCLALGAVATAQDANPAAPAGQRSEAGTASGGPSRGPYGGSGLLGTVTAAAADHYTMKTDAGEIYTVYFSANTRILKQTIQRGNSNAGGSGQRQGPETLRPSDIQVGDTIVALGDVEPAAKSVGAMVVLQVDPERARMMHDMAANYGKSWLLGKVTAIDANKITLLGRIDNAAHSFTTDENTRFSRRRQPITLADIQVGDRVRVEGAVKDGVFVAASVSVLEMPPGGMPSLPR